MNYKTIITVLLFAILKPCMAQSGYMEMKMTYDKGGAGGTFKVYYSPAGSRVETEMKLDKMPNPVQMFSIIKKSNPNIVIQVNETGKTYSEMDISKNKNSASKNETTYTVKKVGNEKLNGYNCVHVIVTSSKGDVEDMWSSKDIADFEIYHQANKNNPRYGSSEEKLKALRDAGAEGFPVKIVWVKKDSKITMELVKIEKKDIPSSMFEVPAGYKKQETAVNPFGADMKSAEEIQKMTPEERTKYIEELKKKFGK